MIETTTSADGTTIAFERFGRGEPLLIIGGALNTRMMASGLAQLLAPYFTVFTVDRRGRGDSGPGGTYAIEREVEDVAAILAEAGGEAHVYGHSSGGALALEAAAAGLPIARLAVYEPPFGAAEPGMAAAISAAVEAGDPGAAALAFIDGLEPGSADGIDQQPWWPSIVAVAHTLPYDMALVGSGGAPVERLAGITASTLVVTGTESPDWARSAAHQVASAIPGARAHAVAGQAHEPADDVLAPVLEEFFG